MILAAAFIMSLPEKLNNDSVADKVRKAAAEKQSSILGEKQESTSQSVPAKEKENYHNHRRNTNPYRRRF
jgi:hypothetical protein